MSLPALVLSLVMASLYAGLFHFAVARRASDLPYYWAAAIIGFLVGSLVGYATAWGWLVVGQVHLLEGTLVAAAALLLAHWLRGARVGEG